MTLEVPSTVEEELRKLAAQRGQEMHVVLEDAIRYYLQATSVTDVHGDDIAQTQMALATELQGVSPWNDE